jgi:hypothetical protein
MIHYLTSANIYISNQISCSSRIAANLSCYSHFNYLESSKEQNTSKIAFFRASCRRTETSNERSENERYKFSLSRVWTNIFWFAVPEISATQNDKFRCVRKGKQKSIKTRKKTRVRLQKCFASHHIKKNENEEKSLQSTSIDILPIMISYLNVFCSLGIAVIVIHFEHTYHYNLTHLINYVIIYLFFPFLNVLL